MKIEGKGKEGFYTITPEEKETARIIAIAIIIASYELAIPYGMGFARAHGTELTKDMAEKMLNGEDISHDYATNMHKANKVNMDYVFGRCCKTYIEIKDNTIDVRISTVDRRPQEIFKRAKEILKGEL